jgi:uncharacterized protein (DUF2147 family)
MTAAMLAPCSQSQAATADPTGYWYKPDAERESKIQVFKCGPGKSQLCAKIAWLKDPTDSQGKPLHDVRNEDPSLRGRSIVGLTIFTGLTPSAPATWTGKIYNPEDGHTYAATLTMVSRTEIRLRGCKAWLLCGEKQWLRTSAPPAAIPAQAPEGTEQIEASVKPDQAAPASPVATAAASPAVPQKPQPQAAPAAVAAAAADKAAPAPAADHAIAPAPAVQAAAAPAEQAVSQPVALISPAQPAAGAPGPQKGYGFLNASMTSDTLTKYSGENVSSMFSMTRPLPVQATQQAAAPQSAAVPAPATQTTAATPASNAAQASEVTASTDEAVPLPAQKPKVVPKPQTVASHSAAKTNVSSAAAPAGQAAPAPEDGSMAEAEADAGTQSAQADTTEVEPVPMTRRQMRRLRRMQEMQQQGQEPLLPWLR